MAAFNHRVVSILGSQRHNRITNRPYMCSVRNCDAIAAYTCRYDYVTGRGARHATANKLRCAVHAEKFATAHACNNRFLFKS